MMWWNDGMGWNNGMGWGGWVAMTLAMVIFWAIVIFALVAIFRRPGDGRPAGGTPGRDPLEILSERFARGEIDADEYHARQEALRTSH